MKFKYGDVVQVKGHDFYEGVIGMVIDFEPVALPGTNRRFTIKFDDRTIFIDQDLLIPESEIVPASDSEGKNHKDNT